jgi:hypothetical protein
MIETIIEKESSELLSISQGEAGTEDYENVFIDEDDIVEIIRIKFDFETFTFDDLLDCIQPWAKKNGYDEEN